MSGLDFATVLLRVLTYSGSVAAAGGILFAMAFPRASQAIAPRLERQILLGSLLLIIVEPLRLLAFQLAIAGGDWALGFGPDLRWMALQTPMGQAMVVRWIAALALLSTGVRRGSAAVAPALILIGSFALEGHTAGSEMPRLVATGALIIHVAGVHWWVGALYPLWALTFTARPELVASVMETFGRRAIWIVVVLLTAGAVLLLILTGGVIDLSNAYHQRFLIKLSFVALLLGLAGWNKLRLTPLLLRDANAGREAFQTSIGLELLVAGLVLMGTAWAINSSPDM